MSNDLPDLVYVDLIEDKPVSREEYFEALGINAAASLAPSLEKKIDQDYLTYLDRFQPFRWHAENGGNHKIGAVGERYFNEADAIANIRQHYGLGTMVYLRRTEHGNELLRSAYPLDQGDVIQLGPDCFAQADGSVLCWKGVNYVPQAEPGAAS